MSALLRDVALIPAPRRERWLLLCVVTAVACGGLLWLQLSLDARLTLVRETQAKQAQQDLRLLTQPTVSQAPLSEAALSEAALEGLRAELLLLNRDWSALLSSLVPADGVRLLALEVNPGSGAVRIGAQADDRAAVTAFVEALEKTEPLAQVRLLRVEQQVSDLVFEVDAQWH